MGTILHYSGGSWQVVASPTTKTLNTVQFVGPTEGWAMGQSGTILHYQGVQNCPLPPRLTARIGSMPRYADLHHFREEHRHDPGSWSP